ncbi:MAG: hypothetical protein CMA67_00325, partial [Euryarchaeota archaeon]|nr:hypothetical protein [Euryarchaeota archaeon]
EEEMRFAAYVENLEKQKEAEREADRERRRQEQMDRRVDRIAEELGLESVQVVQGESREDDTQKSGVAMPLSPAFIYA